LDTLEQPKNLADQAYDVIRNALCDGTLKPGDRVTQNEIADRLDVSRQPVVFALAKLKEQGFLIDAGRRGLAVAPVPPELVTAIYQFRSAVEPLVVRLATGRLDAASVRDLKALVARGRRFAEAKDRRAALDADMAFHSALYRLSGNPIVADTMDVNWQHLRRGMVEVLRSPGLSMSVWREHGQILDAMQAGEADRAAALMQDHVTGAYGRLEDGGVALLS
jgi:DNA-binding GntR family transcriptional regulator